MFNALSNSVSGQKFAKKLHFYVLRSYYKQLALVSTLSSQAVNSLTPICLLAGQKAIPP
jgi:hypothetical protein